MSLTKRATKFGQFAAVGLVVLFIAALAIRDPAGFGHAVKGFLGQIGDTLAGLWNVVRGVASGT